VDDKYRKYEDNKYYLLKLNDKTKKLEWVEINKDVQQRNFHNKRTTQVSKRNG